MMERKGITCSMKIDSKEKVTGVLFIDKHSKCIMNSSEVKNFKISDVNELKSKGAPQENSTSKGNEHQQTQKASASRKM
jgi:hypothetical protein